MSFFYFLAVAVVWGAVALFIATKVAQRVRSRRRTNATRLILFSVLLPLPLVDEIVGKWQFERLCEQHASTVLVERALVPGQTVFSVPQPEVGLRGTWVDIRMREWRYVDASLKVRLISYNTLTARGGRVTSALGLAGEDGSAPFLFKGSCAPKSPTVEQTFVSLGITNQDPPKELSNR